MAACDGTQPVHQCDFRGDSPPFSPLAAIVISIGGIQPQIRFGRQPTNPPSCVTIVEVPKNTRASSVTLRQATLCFFKQQQGPIISHQGIN